ncbi:MAG: bifunctional folylpolyglutamate synthase/dihydrofolate synthase [Alphaproteobacteria bacterium HGW-Alphaproteobacteria-11]|nr:MAG: bifunctional folylpolyglutamate synthase/dihydrofolate synthase [Alphaproteobacteria bacterium HGW-Alphaproteobacteria-11]
MNEKILAASDIILDRLTGLHPKLIDLSLDRTWRLLAALGHPERALPPVFHIAGTNGKGSVAAYLRACLEAGGYAVHSYTSPHLVRFHERIRLAGRPHSAFIDEPALAGLLDECERANDGAPITFFEITTCAALLAFARAPADALILEVGMGGRLDTTNVIEKPAISIITPVDLDHQAFLGDTITLIAAEKAGILKRGAPAIIGPQPDEARVAIEMAAEKTGTKLFIHGQDFTAHEEAGALVYQDEAGLLDLPLPRLAGRHQIDNAGIAICALRQSGILPLDRAAIAEGLTHADWPARLQRLTRGPLIALLPKESDVWLDGGHNPAAGRAVAETMADLAARDPKPLVLVAGMLDTKDAAGFFAPFAGLAAHVETVTIPDAPASLPAERLAEAARAAGLDATPAVSLENAIARAVVDAGRASPRLLICGSLYLAGHILRDHA